MSRVSSVCLDTGGRRVGFGFGGGYTDECVNGRPRSCRRNGGGDTTCGRPSVRGVVDTRGTASTVMTATTVHTYSFPG